MIFQERILKIMSLIEKEGIILNVNLVKILKASEATVRRDLDYLEKENKIRRVRGGAVLAKTVKEEIGIDLKEGKETQAKKKIARLASKFIDEGDSIYLDAGTTTNELIEHLKDKKIKVVTNGLMHLEKLMKYDIETYLLGGKVKRKTKAIVGIKAIEDLDDFSFNKAFMGANGVDELNGYTTHDMEEALVKKKAMKKASKVYVLVDNTKFGISYFSNIAKLDEATIITDKKNINEKILKLTKVIND